MFPIRTDAYPTISESEIADGQVIHGQSPYCNFGDLEHPDYRAIRRLHLVWEHALLRRLGSEKNVDGKRIQILFTNNDFECQYPAQQFKVKDAATI